MREFFSSKIFKLFVALAIILFAFMLRATLTEGFSNVFSSVIGTITTPIQKVTTGFTDSVTDLLYKFVHVNDISKENDALKEENRQLIEQMADYENIKHENESLKKDLGVKEQNPEWTLEKASVVARDPVGRFYSFTIDKGYLDGVSERDPVVTANGLVGIVSEVSPMFSKVITILDISLNVGCYNVRTRDVATVAGDIRLAEDGKTKMSLIPRESGSAKGDIIQTTGTSGLFPKDITIGKISEVEFEPHGTTLYAVIEPTNDIKNVKDVLVITSFRGQGNSLSSFEEGTLEQGDSEEGETQTNTIENTEQDTNQDSEQDETQPENPQP